MKQIILCAMFLFVIGCSKKSNPLLTNEQKGSFEIYYLEDSSLTGYQATQMDINQLILKKEAWLTNEDIQFYDYSSHCIYLKSEKSQFFQNDTGKFFLFDPVLIDKPFVVNANGVRCYVGSLHSSLLSSVPAGPYMDELDVVYYPKDVMHISRAWSSGNDVRNDSRLKDALISMGLYHGGISIALRSVNIIDNSDTATVEYEFTISNNDQDILFVIDPDKMGSGLFHYFTNGVVFRGNGVLFQSMYKEVSTPSTSWDATWFVEIPINSSIERTVRLRGYPKFVAGKYQCNFSFSDPKVEKEDRDLLGGRIWLGELSSSTAEIEIK